MPLIAPARILIVEDDAAIGRLLQLALRRRRLDVALAQDGREAMASLERQRWDVLVSDLMMPNVDGWDLIRWLAAHPDRKPASVIIVSAADREILRDLDPTVVNAIIFKPFEVSQLAAYVSDAARYDGHDRRRARAVHTV